MSSARDCNPKLFADRGLETLTIEADFGDYASMVANKDSQPETTHIGPAGEQE
jgi:hypothetical protein